jgi:hypothetical protein
MKKNKFEFYQDVKVVTWKRQHFSIEAETKEEAEALAKESINHSICYDECVEMGDVEYLMSTEELVPLEDNNFEATCEVYYKDGFSELLIASNAESKEDLRETIVYGNLEHGDWVECSQCGSRILLPCGADMCPVCCGDNTLVWVDKEQEKDLVDIPDKIVYRKKLKLHEYLSPDALADQHPDYYKQMVE